DHWYDLTVDLPPRRALPADFRIRSVTGPDEVEARVSVHRSAFAPSRMTVAKYLGLMQAPTYRRELDLVVEAPGWPEGAPVGDEGCAGSPCFAAFTIVWYDEIHRMGVFEPVGCRPEFQRRGLASAVIIEGMHLLKALGATHCWIGANGDSPGAKTYAALGGYPAQPYEWWARTLKPAATPLAPAS
ncbi:MAG: GNAT family N-acetyltransferase, partial [Caldilineaceae bacterium]